MASEKKSGCLKSVLILIVLFAVGFSAFYMLIWRVPDNSDKAKAEFDKIVARMDGNLKLPPSQNGWQEYEKAFVSSSGSKRPIWKKDPGDLLARGVKEEDREFIEEVKERNKKAFKSAAEGFKKDRVIMPVKFREGAKAIFPNFTAMRKFAQLVGVIAELDRIDGNYREAAEFLLYGIHLGSQTGHNGILFSGMIGIAVIHIDINPLEDMLREDPLDLETCKFITQNMTRINRNFFRFRNLVDSELVMVEFTLDGVPRDGMIKTLNNITGGIPSPGSVAGGLMDAIPSGFLVNRERKIYENWYLDRVELISKDYPALKNGLPEYKFPLLSIINELLVPNMNRAYKKYILVTAKMRGVEILAALEWYQREKGEYPDSLEELVPDYLPELPEDPYPVDKKYIYRKEGDGVYFYSVGEDLKDDGAKRRVSWIGEAGDLVFLTPEMIKGKMQKKRIDVKGKTVVNGTGRSK